MNSKPAVVKAQERALNQLGQVTPSGKVSATKKGEAETEMRKALALVKAEPGPTPAPPVTPPAPVDLRPWVTPPAPTKAIGEPGAVTTLPSGTYTDVLFKGEVRRGAGEAILNRCVFEGPHKRGDGATLLYLLDGITRLRNCEFKDAEGRSAIFQSKGEIELLEPWIHDCGEGTLDQGLYFAGGVGTAKGGLIERIADYGVQFYSPAGYADTVRGMTWDGLEVRNCGRGGVVIAERCSNVVLSNLRSHDNGSYGVYGLGVSGSGNVVRDSHVWGNPQNLAGSGYSKSNVVEKAP